LDQPLRGYCAHAGTFRAVFRLFCNAVRCWGAILLYLSATNANTRIADVQARSATLELEAARLRQSTVGLELDLERERSLRVKMQKEIAWRRITPAQEAKLVEMLRAHPMSVIVEAVAGDPESTLYGDDIRRALKAAGFIVSAGLKNFSGPMHGLGISTNPSDERSIVASAFKAADIEFGDDISSASEVTITVGSKMPPDPKLLSDLISPTVLH
jgi:hypothetical protein